MEKTAREIFLQAALDGENFDDLTEKAAQFLGNPLVVIGNAYNILAHSKKIAVADATWNHAVNRGYITLEFAATLNNWDAIKDRNRKYECVTVDKINNLRRRFYKLTFGGRLLGYLNITEVNGNFDAATQDDYHFAAQILAKEIEMKQQSALPQNSGKSEDILLALLAGTFVDRLHFTERIQWSSFQKQCFYRVICSDLTNFLSYNADADTFKQELLTLFPGATIAIVQKVLVILKPCADAQDCDFLQSPALDRYLKRKKLTMGVSDSFLDLFALPRFQKQAVAAYENSDKVLPRIHDFVLYEQVKIYDMLRLIAKEDLPYFCSQKVLALYHYDAQHKTSYFKTLYAYLACNKSVKATAALLYVHRNTINYRIAQIKDLFLIHLDDFTTASQLMLSCQIMEMVSL